MRLFFLLLALSPWITSAQIFKNYAPQWGVVQYDWDGLYGSGVSTADWNLDGWDDLTFGNSSGAIRTYTNTQGTGFSILPLPINQQAESKAILWLDIDNDGDMDFHYSDAEGRTEILENIGDTTFINVTEITNIPQTIPQLSLIHISEPTRPY